MLIYILYILGEQDSGWRRDINQVFFDNKGKFKGRYEKGPFSRPRKPPLVDIKGFKIWS